MVAAVLLTLAAVFVVAAVWREQEMSARIDDASPLVMEIASLFLCPCPECGNHSVAECTCHMPGGGGHCRRRIAVLLDSGLTRDEVVLRLSAEWELMEAAQGEDSGASAAAEPPR